ncbi:hypothetical protein B0H13DRAFT_2418703 [Mycena leptocephala]|nr:hypothetical protein B0H13DRAFT_2418703 [Mycena leptocephala]
MADREFLERCFPSLRNGVVPVEKYAHLPALEISPNVGVCVIKSRNEIDTAMRTILQDVPDDSDNDPCKIIIFLDSEWNVEISDRGYLTGRGQTAILQIGYKNMIYIIQLGAMLAGGQISTILTQILQNPRVLKVGRAVSGDLKYLERATHPSKPFVGAVELAKMAKDRLVVTNAKIGLADLCAVTLGMRLAKNVPERTSSAWENEDLSLSQIRYAALDVHACSRIYDFLSAIPIPALLPKLVEIGTKVLVFNDDHTRLIARGSIEHLDGSFQTGKVLGDGTMDTINISSSRCLVQISEVVVPAAILKTHKQTLSTFGSSPPPRFIHSSSLHPASINPPTTTNPNSEINSSGTIPPEFSDLDLDSHQSGFGALLLEEIDTTVPHDMATIQNYESDPESQQHGETVLASAAAQAPSGLKDAFHIFNMFYISVAHGLRVEFARALRDAIFIPDAENKARIVAWGQQQNPPRTWEDLVRKSSDWVWRRCKRIIPPPEQLHGDVAEVFRTFGPLKDATTGLPLFNSAAWAAAKNSLELISKGYLSDPPGIALYYQLGVDAKTGLPLYRCMRGTNNTEGGVHTHLRSRLPTSGASVRHANACLKDLILRHNLLVGTFNSTGQRFKGHYSIWLTNEIQELLSSLEHCLIDPILLTGWTTEIFMSEQTKAPESLFFQFTAQQKRNYSLWNSHADQDKDISYKLSEQLKVYFNGDWKTNANIKQTKVMTENARAT